MRKLLFVLLFIPLMSFSQEITFDELMTINSTDSFKRVEQVFKNVRTEVLKLSGDKKQSPVEESKLTGDAFYLNKTTDK